MKLKNLIDEDFVNYKKPSMFIATSICSFKCDKEAGCQVCQNSDLATAPVIDISAEEIVERYVDNPITEAAVIGGLEPFDQFNELIDFITKFRACSNDDIIIYTGYYPNEVKEKLYKLYSLDKKDNIIIKFGRFVSNSTPVYDKLLGVKLASCNQKAMRLEDCFNEIV